MRMKVFRSHARTRLVWVAHCPCCQSVWSYQEWADAFHRAGTHARWNHRRSL